MRVVETLLVRDEVDVIDAHLAFQRSAGVDFVIATDHDSQDGTTDVLEGYARDGFVRLISERGELREAEWRTRMARLAAAEHGADWVINADADQFWWSRGCELHDVLSSVPLRFAAVHAFDRVFVARPPDGAHFAERMIHRLSASAAVNAPASTYRPLARVIHRGEPGINVSLGNHSVSGLRAGVVPHWHPVEVLHFPWRSPEQMSRKSRHFVQAGARHATTYHVEAYRAVTEERIATHYAALTVDDRALERGYEERVIATDTRVRDRLRVLSCRTELRPDEHEYEMRGVPGAFRVELDEPAYAVEASTLRDASLVRVGRLLDGVEQRTRSLETRSASRAPRPRSSFNEATS